MLCSLDPTNKNANEGLLALEQAANAKIPAFEEPMAVAEGGEYQENNFEMVEVQNLTPPNDEPDGGNVFSLRAQIYCNFCG